MLMSEISVSLVNTNGQRQMQKVEHNNLHNKHAEREREREFSIESCNDDQYIP